MQSYIEEFIKRFKMAQEWINELEGKSTKSVHSEKREKQMKENESEILGHNRMYQHTHNGNPEVEWVGEEK